MKVITQVPDSPDSTIRHSCVIEDIHTTDLSYGCMGRMDRKSEVTVGKHGSLLSAEVPEKIEMYCYDAQQGVL